MYKLISYYRLPKAVKHIISNSSTALYCKKYELPFSFAYKEYIYTYWAVDLPVMVDIL